MATCCASGSRWKILPRTQGVKLPGSPKAPFCLSEKGYKNHTGDKPADVRAEYERSVSLRSFIDPEDIAAMALFVCSDAGAKISGQALAVDGHTETLSH